MGDKPTPGLHGRASLLNLRTGQKPNPFSISRGFPHWLEDKAKKQFPSSAPVGALQRKDKAKNQLPSFCRKVLLDEAMGDNPIPGLPAEW